MTVCGYPLGCKSMQSGRSSLSLSLIVKMIEAETTSETSVIFYQTTLRA